MELRISVLVFCAALAGCTRDAQSPVSAKPSPDNLPDNLKVRITQFYASPARPPKGEKTLLCYGVENASEVRLDPAIERVWPSIARCFDIDSTKETTYKLTAVRGKESVSQSVTVTPGAPAVKIIEVLINKLDFEQGEEATVCYKAKNSVSTTLEPGVWLNLHSPAFGCKVDHPGKTTTYTVNATGAGGDIDTERVTAKVR